MMQLEEVKQKARKSDDILELARKYAEEANTLPQGDDKRRWLEEKATQLVEEAKRLTDEAKKDASKLSSKFRL